MGLDLALLLTLAFLAGLLDAVVGGGGLIQIPALFGYLPQAPPATVFGTNKIASIAGTGTAALRFARHVPIRWGAALPAAASAFAFSFLGARTVTLLPPEVIRPLVLVLLVAMAAFTALRKDFGSVHAPRHEGSAERLYAVLLGGAIGFYDGFFGPGTGTFLVFLFVRFFGFDFLGASAASKVVNVATNAAALLYFGFTGNILYLVGIPMALCNVLGAVAGSRLAIRRGSGFVRWVFLAVVSVLILKFAWESMPR
jgi:uncharacterized membrane protein YfcA